MRTENFVLLNGSSLAVSVSSSAISMDSMMGIAIQCVITGAPTGTLKLQASCDKGDENLATPGGGIVTWIDIAGTSQAIAGAPINVLYNQTDQFVKWLRVVYTATAGAGNITVTVNAKGF